MHLYEIVEGKLVVYFFPSDIEKVTTATYSHGLIQYWPSKSGFGWESMEEFVSCYHYKTICSKTSKENILFRMNIGPTGSVANTYESCNPNKFDIL